MTTAADSRILKRLEELERQEGSLSESLKFCQRLLLIQSQVRSRIGVPKIRLSQENISNRLSSGSPIIRFADLSIDWSLLRYTFEEVNGLFANYSGVLGEVPENLKELGSYPDLLKEAIKAWFEGAPLPPQITVSEVDKALLEVMLLATLRPFLINHSEALIGFVEQEQWRRGYCPVCGGNPDFAFLEKEYGARWLLCSRCDAEWLFQRLECPYCSTQDQSALAYFTDEKELYRLYTCELCRHYLKAIDLRKTESEVLLPLERFLTLDLDTQAQKEGYSPGASVRQGKGVEKEKKK